MIKYLKFNNKNINNFFYILKKLNKMDTDNGNILD